MSKDHDGVELWYMLLCPSCWRKKYVKSLEYNQYCECGDLMKYWKNI